MELATDIMAIIGFFTLGANLPKILGKSNQSLAFEIGIAFGLIAASFVLGS